MISPNSLAIGQPALRGDRIDEILSLGGRRLTDLARRELRVLLVDRAHEVRRRELQLGETVGLDPDPHRVVLRAEDLHVGRPGQPLQLVEDVERHVVRGVEVVERAGRRVECQHLQERRAAALDSDALAAHFLREPRLDLLHAVVDVDRGVVDARADFERDLDRKHAVRGRRARHVDHVRHAIDRGLDRSGDGLARSRRRTRPGRPPER